ncbi:hypothetical protein FO519_003455 [Halicephalobus sp. NKZ332]|nr:hypothetical protein FO519_003455 [Halicephalobus sp. NKZ332]
MPTLVVGEIDPFVAGVTNRMVNARLLGSVNPNSNKAWLDKSLEVFYGSPENEKLVSKILEDEKVNSIVYIPSGLGSISRRKSSIGDYAKKQLFRITHFLDGWRKSKNAQEQTLIFVSSFSVYGKDDVDPSHKTSLKPMTELGAALMASEALLHSYAVSYKLNIKILRLRSADPPKCLEDIVTALNLLKSHKDGVCQIFHMPSDTSSDFADDNVTNLTSIPGWRESPSGDSQWMDYLLSKSFIPAARVLVFGSRGWIGEQFLELLKQKKIEVVSSKSRPGSDSDDVIAKEITEVSPSHVVSMVGRTQGPGCGNIDYLEGGPEKLKENVGDNLFAPWILAKFCDEFGLHFTYLGTGCLYQYNEEHQRNGKGYTESETPNFTGNKYSVVKGFTDQSLGFFKNTLNARIRLPINDDDSPRNLLRKLIGFKKVIDIPNSITYLPDCLPILLELILKQEIGTLNLVNPGSISFPRILGIYEEETGKKLEFEVVQVDESSPAVQTRAHCTLDTTRLETLFSEVLSIESAVRKAVEKISIHLS